MPAMPYSLSPLPLRKHPIGPTQRSAIAVGQLRASLCALALGGAVCLPLAAQTLERIKKTGVFTIAHREASVPLSYLIPGNAEPQGLAVALCQRVAQAIKAELKLPKLELRYVAVSSSTRIPVIQEGKADIECGSTTDNAARREQVAFSHHHFFAAVQYLSRTQQPLASWSELQGKRVVFTQGTTTQAALAASALTKDLKYTVLQGKDHAESFALLANGSADAFVLEDVLLAGLRAGAPDPKAFVLGGRRLTIEPYALMMKKDDEAFQQLVNRELRRTYQSGEYAQLYKRWFESPIPPSNLNLELPMGVLLREQMRKPSSVIPG
jgi:ABC-type amino acid transport substrate-binding protein